MDSPKELGIWIRITYNSMYYSQVFNEHSNLTVVGLEGILSAVFRTHTRNNCSFNT